MKLSILICSIYKRKDQLKTLIDSLLPQLYDEPEFESYFQRSVRIERYFTNDIEIIAGIDNKFITVGEKRNMLLREAKGDYVCFIDDDDTVTDDYVSNLIRAIKFDRDVITFQVMYNPAGGTPKLVKYCCKYKDAEMPECYLRVPNHLMCFKRVHALKVKYRHISRGEDFIWANEMKPLIRTEGQIDKVLYYYNFDFAKTETQ